MTDLSPTPPPIDMDQVRDTAFWRVIVVLAAFLTCLTPLLLGLKP